MDQQALAKAQLQKSWQKSGFPTLDKFNAVFDMKIGYRWYKGVYYYNASNRQWVPIAVNKE